MFFVVKNFDAQRRAISGEGIGCVYIECVLQAKRNYALDGRSVTTFHILCELCELCGLKYSADFIRDSEALLAARINYQGQRKKETIQVGRNWHE